jgi:tRNA G18 (ribose-2'-O)-methylase SpoU
MQKLKLDELGRESVSEFKAKEKFPLILVLDNVRSALNVGSCFRTADAFAIEKILCIGITATPPHREILKTALGSTDSVDWDYCESIENAVQSGVLKDCVCLAIEQTSKSVLLDDYVFDKTKRYALFFGNEVDGVSDSVLSICQDALEIPQFGTKHSLNVSVCIGILSWEFVRQTGF